MAKKRKKRDPDSIPVLTKKLDAVFSRWVRWSAADSRGMVKCVTCDHIGHAKTLQAGHWIPRQHKICRWSPWNVHAQCYACNMHYGGRPQEYREWLVAIHGEETVKRLAMMRHKVKQWTREELKEMIEDYGQKLQEVEAYDDSYH